MKTTTTVFGYTPLDLRSPFTWQVLRELRDATEEGKEMWPKDGPNLENQH